MSSICDRLKLVWTVWLDSAQASTLTPPADGVRVLDLDRDGGFLSPSAVFLSASGLGSFLSPSPVFLSALDDTGLGGFSLFLFLLLDRFSLLFVPFFVAGFLTPQ